MAARIGKVVSFTLLAAFCFVNNSCSMTNNHGRVDVTGCGLIKWGMTLDQVKTLLGPKARIETDPLTGKRLETVTVRIGNMELSGVVTTELHTERINGVGLMEQDGHPLKEPMFETLKLLITENYGAPSREYSLASSRRCSWGFASGNILLTSYDEIGNVSLHYMENPSGASYQTPLQN